jgi:hypothetical protein
MIKITQPLGITITQIIQEIKQQTITVPIQITTIPTLMAIVQTQIIHLLRVILLIHLAMPLINRIILLIIRTMEILQKIIRRLIQTIQLRRTPLAIAPIAALRRNPRTQRRIIPQSLTIIQQTHLAITLHRQGMGIVLLIHLLKAQRAIRIRPVRIPIILIQTLIHPLIPALIVVLTVVHLQARIVNQVTLTLRIRITVVAIRLSHLLQVQKAIRIKQVRLAIQLNQMLVHPLIVVLVVVLAVVHQQARIVY